GAPAGGIRGLARRRAEMVWEREAEGGAPDTPERRASLQRAVEQRVADIADPVVRDYYRTDMRARLARLRRADAPAWQPRRRWFRDAAPEPAPFAAGAAARRDTDPRGSHQAPAVPGARVERPALLHVPAADLAALPLPHAA